VVGLDGTVAVGKIRSGEDSGKAAGEEDVAEEELGDTEVDEEAPDDECEEVAREKVVKA
jgi:hypothetical protein